MNAKYSPKYGRTTQGIEEVDVMSIETVGEKMRQTNVLFHVYFGIKSETVENKIIVHELIDSIYAEALKLETSGIKIEPLDLEVKEGAYDVADVFAINVSFSSTNTSKPKWMKLYEHISSLKEIEKVV